MTRPQPIDALLTHSDWIDRLARRLVADPNEADEIVQEAWLRAIAAPPTDDENLRGWMARVVRRVLARRQRAALRRSDYEGRAPERRGPRTPDDLASEVALQRRLEGAVLELPPQYRDVLLLRYFEDLPPRRIAERLDVPLNTVRSRLQRGTEALRSQLDEEHGSRRRWALALIPLASRAAIHETAATAIGLGVAGTVGLTSIVGGVLVVAHAMDGGAPTAPDFTSLPATETAQAESGGSDELVAPAAPAPGRRGVIAPAPESDERERPGVTRLVGTVVETDGVPAPHVRMRRQSRNAVRWQGGDRGWISGPGGSRRISAADEARAREDADFARELLDGLPEQDEWRATLLGSRLPGRDVSADPAGQFVFEGPEAEIGATAIEVADPDWFGLARGQRVDEEDARSPVWVAARAHRMEGRVVDPGGSAVARGAVRLIVPVDRALARLPFEFEVDERATSSGQNIEGGDFLVRQAPIGVGATLFVTAQGFRAREIPVPRVLPESLEIVLEPLDASEVWRITGRVLDRAGRATAGATVALGDARTRTGADGAFELEAEDLRHTDDLVAVASGVGATILGDHGRRLLDGSASDRVDLVLDDADGVLRGRIEGNAEARAGWHVTLDDPTVLEFSFSSIEKRAMGREGDVVVEADGTFTLRGLLDRTYTLRMWRPKTGAVHLVPGVRAGDSIATDPSSSLRTVRGTVTDGDGATVAVIQRTFVNADGGGGLVDSGPPATCDEKGRFELPIVPRAGAALRVTLASGLSYLVPVERIGEETEVELQAPDASILDVRTDYLAEAHTLHVEDAAGRILPVWTLRAGGAGAFREVVESEGGRFPLTHVPPSAAVAVVTRPDGSHSELPFTPTPGGLVPVRLR